MSNIVGALIGVPDSYETYMNWILLPVVGVVVIFFGAKDLARQKREYAVEQEKVHAMSD